MFTMGDPCGLSLVSQTLRGLETSNFTRGRLNAVFGNGGLNSNFWRIMVAFVVDGHIYADRYMFELHCILTYTSQNGAQKTRRLQHSLSLLNHFVSLEGPTQN